MSAPQPPQAPQAPQVPQAPQAPRESDSFIRPIRLAFLLLHQKQEPKLYTATRRNLKDIINIPNN